MAAALQQSVVALRAAAAAAPPARRVAARAVALRSSNSIAVLRISTGGRRRRGGATMIDTAAGSYAAALSDVANGNSTLAATNADMEKVATIFSDKAVFDYFANPTVAIEKKLELVADIAKTSSLQPHTANFLSILVEMKRTDMVKEIAKEFEKCYNRITGTEVALVTSVVPLESQHLAQIAKSIQRLTKAKNVRIKTTLDPSLVAGFTIRYGASGSKFIDMSVKKQLAEIAKQLDFSDIVLSS
ncbi:F-type H+-transporting ATPase subunit delta [Wolffia australiana]